MKIQNIKCKMQNYGTIFFPIFLLTLFLLLPFTAVFAEEGKWAGVDESVVEKYAKEHGREAMTPLINTDQGDLLLFVFLVAGTVGGFAAGYYWKELTTEKERCRAAGSDGTIL